MTLTEILALAATSLGFVTAAIALLHTTPLTMLAFFFIGLGGFAGGFVLYAIAVFSELRAKRIL